MAEAAESRSHLDRKTSSMPSKDTLLGEVQDSAEAKLEVLLGKLWDIGQPYDAVQPESQEDKARQKCLLLHRRLWSTRNGTVPTGDSQLLEEDHVMADQFTSLGYISDTETFSYIPPHKLASDAKDSTTTEIKGKGEQGKHAGVHESVG